MKSSVQLTRSQSLRLTPQLQLAIKLLQHSRKVPERSLIADPKAERSEG